MSTETAAAPVEILPIDHGALTKCPVWETHSRGKNWAATITVDPVMPGGLGRQFWDHAQGADHYYLVPPGLRVGDAVEFAGDYFTGGGSRQKDRHFRTVTAVTADALTMACYDTAREAIDAGAAARRALDAPKKITSDLLDSAVEDALVALNEAVTEPGYTWYTERHFDEGQVVELRFQLLDDDAARARGLLD